jgi:uncharacterized protein YycO
MIALFKGTSLLSRYIRVKTWSEYSHAAWVDEGNGEMWEAWKGGVTCSVNLDARHAPGTRIDLFHVDGVTAEHTATIRAYMEAQEGKPYDWPGLFGFVTRRCQAPGEDQERWFCSELVYAAHLAAEIALLRNIPAWKVSPALLSYSPRARYIRTHVVGRDDPREVCGECWRGQ